MPTQVQFRRGTTTQNNNFTGAAGELSVDTTLNVIRVHDGTTAGGHTLLSGSSTATLTNKTFNLSSNTLAGTIAQFNTALSDGDFATLAGSETLTNKTLTTPTIAQINAAADFTVDAAGDIILDADGADVLLKDGGTTFGSLSQSGGELVIKSGATPTTAITMSGADVTISGNLTVNGATTTVTSNTVTLGDNTILLNSDEAGTPSQDAGIEVERGTSTNASLIWVESTDVWAAGLAGAEVPLVTTTGTQTLTNKTLTTPVISSISNTGSLTLPTSTDTLVGRATTDTLTNKSVSLTTNTVTGTLAEFNTALTDADFASLAGAETLTNKTITSPSVSGLYLSDASIVFEGSTANEYETTLTVTDPTADRTITLPNATDTLVGKATTDTFTNKTINVDNATGNVFQIQGNTINSYVGSGANVVLSSSPTITNLYVPGTGMYFSGSTSGTTNVQATAIAGSTTLTLPAATDTLVGKATTDTLTNKSISLTTNTITGTLAEFNTAVTDANLASVAGSETLTNKTISVDDNTVSGIAASSFVLSNASGYIDGSASQKAIPSGTVVGTSDSQTLTNKTIALGNNTVTGTLAQFNTAVTDADFASLAGAETLTNKTLTSPVVTGLTLNDASIVFEGATANDFETTLTVTDPTADRTITLPDATTTLVGTDTTQTLTNKTLTSPVIGTISNTGTLTLPTSTDTLVGRATTDTLTNKTIDAASNTLSNIANSSLTNSSITINGTSTALGGTRTLVTDDIAEDGSPVNLWYTDARARASISVTDSGGDGSLSYNSGTGVLTYTGPSATEVRAHLSAGTGLTYSSGQFAIDSTVATLTGSQTLTSKTIALGSNTVSGTLAQFNTALTDADFASLSGTETLTNKTLTSPTMTTPTLGVASATSINKVAFTAPATSATLTIADGKTLTASNTLTFTGTDSSSVAFGTGGTVAYTANKLSAFAATSSSELAGVISDETGSGSLVFSASPTFTGTVNAANLTLSGDLTVNGTTTTVNSNTVNIGDNIIVLNSDEAGTPSQNAGIEVERGTSTNASVTWDETNDLWMAGLAGAEVPLVTTTGTQTLTNKTISGSSNTISNIANASLTNSTISGKALGTNLDALTLAVSGTGLSGSASYNGSSAATFTVTSNATNANTGSTIVARDASGNFSAGTITAALSGNATTATTLATARSINGVSFNGSADITVTAAAGTLSGSTLASGVTASSLTSVGTLTSLAVGGSTTVTGGGALVRNAATQDGIELRGRAGGTGNWEAILTPTTLSADRTFTFPDVSGNVITTGDTGTVTSTMIADGTIVNADINASAAIAVSKLAASTISGVTLGNNLNTLTMNVSGTGLSGSTTYNGSGASTFTVTSNATSANTASAIVARDASGNFSAGTITAALSGNATTATTLATARNIQGVSFNGSADITVVTAGTGVSVSGTAVSIGQAVATSSNVTFANMTSTGVLTVSNGSTTSNGIKFGADPGGGSGDLAQINYYASTGETTVLHLQVDNDADDTIKLDATGGTDNVGAFRATGEITAYYSDERLKNFSGTIDNALSKVMSLNGYYYTENELAKSFGFNNDKQQVGVSAQQVQNILPEAVRVAPFVRDLELTTEYLTVQYEKLVPLLIEAIKEQQKKIEELEAKINK